MMTFSHFSSIEPVTPDALSSPGPYHPVLVRQLCRQPRNACANAAHCPFLLALGFGPADPLMLWPATSPG